MFGQNKHESNTQPQPHTTNTHHPASKAHLSTFNGPEQIPTAVKRQESNQLYTQMTPKPQRKILLYGENHGRFLFPLVRDRDVGIPAAYQNIVIESHNDDDRETTSTQLQRGMVQTMEDLYDVLSRNTNSQSPSYYTQQRNNQS